MCCRSSKVLKCLFIALNVLLFAGGCLLLGLGAWVSADGVSFTTMLGAENFTYFLNFYFFIFIGVVLIIMSCVGIIGAIRENQCLLGTYFGIVLFAFLLQLAGTVMNYLYFPPIAFDILFGMRNFEFNIKPPNSSALTDNWNRIQREDECCGYDSHMDWIVFRPTRGQSLFNFGSQSVISIGRRVLPASCCITSNGVIENELSCIQGAGSYYRKGCGEKVTLYFTITGAFSIAILVVEFLAIVFSCILRRSTTKV